MIYTVITSREFEKGFAKLDSYTQTRVLVCLEKMCHSPFADVKKLKNVSMGVFRKRIGDYRLRFDIDKNKILLYVIRHRKDVYKK